MLSGLGYFLPLLFIHIQSFVGMHTPLNVPYSKAYPDRIPPDN